MQLLAITPISVSDDERARRQARYRRLAPPSIEVELENLGSGSQIPRALETSADIRASACALVERYSQVDASGWDGFLPDCVLDPVDNRSLPLGPPVFGLGRLAAHHLAGLGLTMVAVARNAAIATELDRRFAEYRVQPAARTMNLGLSVDDISDDAVWGARVAEKISLLDCSVVFNACSAVDVAVGTGGPALVDPTWTALRVLAAGTTPIRTLP